MNLQLTDRQQVLFDRLVTLGDWVKNGDFPMIVHEIRGFGSFFRGKSRPSDVDLILKIERSKRLPEFERFIELLYSIRNDWDLEESFSKPSEAISAIRASNDSRCSGITDIDHQKYLSWIEPYSWNMLRPNTIIQELEFESPEKYTKRMIKKHLPNLNIFDFQNYDDKNPRPLGLMCGFIIPIWSQHTPDMKANLTEILSSKIVIQNLLREKEYFDVKLPALIAKTELIETEINLLLSIKRRRKKNDVSWKWLEDWSKDHDDLKTVRAKYELADKVALQFNESRDELSIPATDENVELKEIAGKTDKQRKEIKVLTERISNLEEIRNELAYYKSGAAKTDFSAKEYVVDSLLSKGSKRKKEKLSKILGELRFPVDLKADV